MGVYSNLAAQTVRGESTNNMNAMLNLMVEATAADTNMFNSIIELDFQEAAANKDGGSYITEAEEGTKATKKSIIDKIKAFLSKVWTAIKTAFESFFVKVSETFGNDKKFAEKYKYDDIAKDFKKKMEKCDMEVTIPDKDVIDSSKFKDGSTYIGYIKDEISSETDYVKIGIDEFEKKLNLNTSEKIDEFKKTFDEETEAAYKVLDESSSKKMFVSKKANEVTDELLIFVNAGYVSMKSGFSNEVRALKALESNALTSIDALKKQALVERNMQDDALEIKLYSTLYTCVTNMGKYLSKQNSFLISEAKQYMLAARGTYIKVAKYLSKNASDKKDETKTTDNATETAAKTEASLVGELSDIYVSEALDM